jgi:hypothetical protein
VTIIELHTPANLMPFCPAGENSIPFDVVDAIDDADTRPRIHREAGTKILADWGARREVNCGGRAVQAPCESKTPATLVRYLYARKPIRLS